MGNNPQINKASRCAVIGHGSWATALVKVLTTNESTVGWYVRNADVLESLRVDGRNCRYLSEIEFDLTHLRLSDDLNATVSEAEIIFFVMPAVYIKCYLSDLQVSLEDKMVVSAIKGVIPDEKMFVTDYLKKHFELSDSQLCFICGPTHAEEVSHGQLTYLTLACQDMVNTRVVGEKLKTPFIRINCQKDIKYLERSSVLKNIYSVMVGIAVGLGYGDNFISVLVANCIKEMYFLLDPQSVNDLTKFSPSNFFGDLLVSCYSSHSRNRQLGVLIGRGNSVKTALNEMTMVAEGYFASALMPYLTDAQRMQLPIANTAYQVLHQSMPARKAMKNLEDLLT